MIRGKNQLNPAIEVFLWQHPRQLDQAWLKPARRPRVSKPPNKQTLAHLPKWPSLAFEKWYQSDWCVDVLQLGKRKHWRPHDLSLSGRKPGRRPEAVSLQRTTERAEPGPRNSHHANGALWRDCLVSYFGRPLRDEGACLVSNNPFKVLRKVKSEGRIGMHNDDARGKSKNLLCNVFWGAKQVVQLF